MRYEMLHRSNAVLSTYHRRIHIAKYLCRYSRAIKVKQSRIHRSPTIPILRMEQHVLPIVVNVCSSRRNQTVSIACLEQRILRTSVGTRY